MPNWLGDCVMAAPSIMGLRAALPHCQITLLMKSQLAGLGRLIPSANDVLPLDDAGGYITKARAEKFDTALVLPNSFRSAWEVFRTGAPARIGYAGDLRSWLLTRPVAKPGVKHSLHQSEYFLRLAREIAPDITIAAPELTVTAEAKAKAGSILPPVQKPFVGFGFGATYGSAKMWPSRKFAELAARLSSDYQIVLLGGEADRWAEDEILKTCEKVKPFSLVGKTDIGALAAVMARLAIYITNDTGPMHISAALGTPTLAIFGPTSPEETSPLGPNVKVIYKKAACAPCWKRKCPTDHLCMESITVDEVYGAALEMLRRK